MLLPYFIPVNAMGVWFALLQVKRIHRLHRTAVLCACSKLRFKHRCRVMKKPSFSAEISGTFPHHTTHEVAALGLMHFSCKAVHFNQIPAAY